MADRPEMSAPTRGFSGMADSIEPCKMLWGQPLLPWQRNLGWAWRSSCLPVCQLCFWFLYFATFWLVPHSKRTWQPALCEHTLNSSYLLLDHVLNFVLVSCFCGFSFLGVRDVIFFHLRRHNLDVLHRQIDRSNRNSSSNDCVKAASTLNQICVNYLFS